MRKELKLPRAIKLAEIYKDESKKDEKNTLVVLGHEIANKMKNGITYEDGRTRAYDVIDYYNDCKLPLYLFYVIIRDQLSLEEQRLFGSFIGKVVNSEKLSLRILYGTKSILELKYDENGNLIEGSGREITTEEKEALVKFIESHEWELTKTVYDAAFNRWKNGFLEMPTKFNIDENNESRHM